MWIYPTLSLGLYLPINGGNIRGPESRIHSVMQANQATKGVRIDLFNLETRARRAHRESGVGLLGTGTGCIPARDG